MTAAIKLVIILKWGGEMGKGEMRKKKTGTNKRLQCRCPRQRQLKKFKNQMSLSKTTIIESNSNPQFVTFELLKEKMLSRTIVFAKHTSLGISLAEKLNSSIFSP